MVTMMMMMILSILWGFSWLNYRNSLTRETYISGIRHSSVVVSPSKLSDDVITQTISHRLESTDSRADAPVPQSLSSCDSAAQPAGHDETYELSHPERPYYDAVQPRPPLPSQPPSGKPSDCIFCRHYRSFQYRTFTLIPKIMKLYCVWCLCSQCRRLHFCYSFDVRKLWGNNTAL